MKRTMTILGVLMVSTTPVLASGGPEAEGIGILLPLFLGFGALIVACQLIPGLVLFFSILRALFVRTKSATAPAIGR